MISFECDYNNGAHPQVLRHLLETNDQQFVVLANDLVQKLEQKVLFTHWGPLGKDKTICRFVTSWSTTEANLARLEEILNEL